METGLAIAGGGVPGCAAVGVLMALEEAGQICRAMGANRVISIDPISLLVQASQKPTGAFSILKQVILLNLKQQMAAEHVYSDLTLIINVGQAGPFDFHKARECVDAGYYDYPNFELIGINKRIAAPKWCGNSYFSSPLGNRAVFVKETRRIPIAGVSPFPKNVFIDFNS